MLVNTAVDIKFQYRAGEQGAGMPMHVQIGLAKLKKKMDPELKAMFAPLIQAQAVTDSNLKALTEQISQSDKLHRRWAAAADERAKAADERAKAADERAAEMDRRLTAAHERTEAAIANLNISIDRYITTSDERMKRLEENLDGLIRAITRDHSNGKAQH